MPQKPTYKVRKILASNVRRERMARGWSQEGLGSKAGTSQVYISEIETGKKAASVDVLEALASALSCEPYELLRPSDI